MREDKIIDDPKEMAKYILEKCEGFTMPGWEPERMAHLTELFDAYKDVTKEKLWENLRYFLEALNADLPRNATSSWRYIRMTRLGISSGFRVFLSMSLLIDRFLKMVDDPYNCLTLCSWLIKLQPEE